MKSSRRREGSPVLATVAVSVCVAALDRKVVLTWVGTAATAVSEFVAVVAELTARFCGLEPLKSVGQESAASNTRANAIPSPAVAMGLSGNFKA